MQKALITVLFFLVTMNAYSQARTPGTELDNGVGTVLRAIKEINEEANQQIKNDTKNMYFDIQGTVVSIADGDTLTILDSNNVQHKIRLNAIDAPELGQPFGNASKKLLSEFCYNETAKVRKVDVDRYNRIVGDVRCGDRELFVSAILVKKGMAWVYDKYVRDDYFYLYALQKSAQDKQQGLWADSEPIAPWDWRKSTRPRSRVSWVNSAAPQTGHFIFIVP